MEKKEEVIVLGGQYGALSVVKALYKEGIQPVLFSSGSSDRVSRSRFTSERIQSYDPMENGDGLLSDLMDYHTESDRTLLIPTLDEYVVFIAQNRDELNKKYVFTIQEWEETRRIICKDQLYTQAQEIGVPTPIFFLPDSLDYLDKNRIEFSYPCILKPYESHRFRDVYKKKVVVIKNHSELVNTYQEIEQNKMNVIISEIIPGDDSSIYSYRSYINQHGSLVAEIFTQKLHQFPPRFGQGSLVRTVPEIAEIRDYALKLLNSLSYRGESSAEFKFDYRDHRFKLMEINIRPVVTERLFVEAGVNFPFITYMDLVKNTNPPALSYDKNVYWIHNYWEFINFLTSFRGGKYDLKDYFALFGKKRVYLYPFLEDPVHFFSELLQYARNRLRYPV